MPRQTNRGRRFSAEPLTSEEVERLIEAVSGRGATAVRNRALIALLWRSGLRISEALALRPSDIDERQGTVLVRRGKGGKARIAVIDAKALGYLRAWTEVRKQLGVNGRQPLFCT